MELNKIQYDVIMMAIDNAKNLIAENDFIDPYAENPDGYTNEALLEALEKVEQKILDVKK